MSFWKLYYHVVWSTRERAPIVTTPIEKLVTHAIRQKSTGLKCVVHAVNGVADHIHVAVSIPPRIAVADWVKEVKGRSAYEVNDFYPDLEPSFAWQTSYGVLSFGEKHLSTVVNYIANQKNHHADGSIIAYLEKDDD